MTEGPSPLTPRAAASRPRRRLAAVRCRRRRRRHRRRGPSPGQSLQREGGGSDLEAPRMAGRERVQTPSCKGFMPPVWSPGPTRNRRLPPPLCTAGRATQRTKVLQVRHRQRVQLAAALQRRAVAADVAGDPAGVGRGRKGAGWWGGGGGWGGGGVGGWGGLGGGQAGRQAGRHSKSADKHRADGAAAPPATCPHPVLTATCAAGLPRKTGLRRGGPRRETGGVHASAAQRQAAWREPHQRRAARGRTSAAAHSAGHSSASTASEAAASASRRAVALAEQLDHAARGVAPLAIGLLGPLLYRAPAVVGEQPGLHLLCAHVDLRLRW